MSHIEALRNILPLARTTADRIRFAAATDADLGNIAERATAAVVGAEMALMGYDEAVARLVAACEPFKRYGFNPLTSQTDELRAALSAFPKPSI